MSVRIILIATSHPGNIGSAARAMKTMGLDQLYLVNPKEFPSDKAQAMASGATDLLERAVVCGSLSEALEGCQLIFGCSARNRYLEWPLLDSRQACEQIQANRETEIAILFGRERTGLTNEELQACHYHIQIPANPDYPSLNLASAVQIISYELKMAANAKITKQEPCELAKHQDIEYFFVHLEKTLTALEFLNPKQPKRLMGRLRRLYQRAQLEKQEANILRGILTAIDRRLEQ